MFGYVRPFKPYMRIFEYDIYKAVYCGLCKTMGEKYGFVSRLTLSYDFTFLALFHLSVSDKKLDAKKERCIAHPFKKTMCAVCHGDFDYSSAAAVILTYHKLKDDMADKGIHKKLIAALAIPFFKKPYKNATKVCSGFSEKVESAMTLQNQLEKDRNSGIDQACEPTAQMMAAAFGGITQNDTDKSVLERFGYLLGRYIYITDALDDLKEDYKKGDYNPLLVNFSISNENKGDEITQTELEKIHKYTDDNINFTLGELAECYVKLECKRYKDILDNIIYLGLKNVYSAVRAGKFRRSDKENKKTDKMKGN